MSKLAAEPQFQAALPAAKQRVERIVQMRQGFYVDEVSGEVKCTDTSPAGCHFELHENSQKE